jgi:phosphoribosylformylglycinamidine cyclo-ligase
VHAMSHVTGGGLAANLERVLPDSVVATVDRGTWTPQPVFDLVRRVGNVAEEDLERTLNCGVGMVAALPADDVDRAVAVLAGHGVRAWVCGSVAAAPGEGARDATGSATGSASKDTAGKPGGTVSMVGRHPGW